MRFKDGKFKLLVLSDIHTPDRMPRYTREFCSLMIKEESPDLIVLLGDSTAGHFPGANEEKTKKAADEVLSLVGDIPFALVFGNHDHEGLPEYEEMRAKELLLEYYGRKSNCLASRGECDGVGNYRLDIEASDSESTAFSLCFFDSGAYRDGGYASVTKNQIAWWESRRDKAVPSMVFQHIIVPEIYDCCDKSEKRRPGYTKGQCDFSGAYYKFRDEHYLSGYMKEGPCPGRVNEGQFDAMVKDGGVIAAVFGHDHVNDFDVMYKGIRLINTPSPSFYTYGNNRGVRVITLNEHSPREFETKVVRYEDKMKAMPKNPFVRRYGIALYRQNIRPAILAAATVAALTAAAVKGTVKRK